MSWPRWASIFQPLAGTVEATGEGASRVVMARNSLSAVNDTLKKAILSFRLGRGDAVGRQERIPPPALHRFILVVGWVASE